MSTFQEYKEELMSRRYIPMETICSVLQDMRKCNEVRNYSTLASLIEEAQMMANRMETALELQKTYFEMRDECREKRKELEDLEKQIEEKERELKP